jgi:FkbM family methyltransferase
MFYFFLVYYVEVSVSELQVIANFSSSVVPINDDDAVSNQQINNSRTIDLAQEASVYSTLMNISSHNISSNEYHSHTFRDFGSIHNRNSLRKAHKLLHSGRCKHVYLDMGTNIGIQIRKLYEPGLYVKGKILPYFDKYFGSVENRKEVCAFGVEANPIHTKRLDALEQAYTKLGYPVVIFTETAAGNKNGNITFFQEKEAHPAVHEWGASIYNWRGTMMNVTVGMLDIALFLKHLVYNRADIKADSKVVIKMDIEGFEYHLIPYLFSKNVLCQVDFMYIEFHPQMDEEAPKDFSKVLEWFIKTTPDCRCEFADIDDEAYGVGNDPFDLPGVRIRRLRSSITSSDHDRRFKPKNGYFLGDYLSKFMKFIFNLVLV